MQVWFKSCGHGLGLKLRISCGVRQGYVTESRVIPHRVGHSCCTRSSSQIEVFVSEAQHQIRKAQHTSFTKIFLTPRMRVITCLALTYATGTLSCCITILIA